MASPKFAEFDLSAFPKVRLTFHRSPGSQQEMDDYLTEFEALLKAALSMDQTIRFIFSLEGMSIFSCLPYMDAQVDFVKRIAKEGSAKVEGDEKARLVDGVKGTAIIFSNSIVRQLVQAILERVTLQKPYYAAKSVEDAEKWLDGL